MNDVNTYIKPAEEKMEMAVEYLDETLAHIRAGKANPTRPTQKFSTVSKWIITEALRRFPMWQTSQCPTHAQS